MTHIPINKHALTETTVTRGVSPVAKGGSGRE